MIELQKTDISYKHYNIAISKFRIWLQIAATSQALFSFPFEILLPYLRLSINNLLPFESLYINNGA